MNESFTEDQKIADLAMDLHSREYKKISEELDLPINYIKEIHGGVCDNLERKAEGLLDESMIRKQNSENTILINQCNGYPVEYVYPYITEGDEE